MTDNEVWKFIKSVERTMDVNRTKMFSGISSNRGARLPLLLNQSRILTVVIGVFHSVHN